MSNVMFVISPTLSALGDKRMGTTGNKMDCAAHHFGNAFKYNTIMGAAIGTAGAIGYVRAQHTLSGNILKKAAQIYKAIPAPIKLAAGVAWATALALKSYNKGKIQQRYIDKAQFTGDVDRNNGIAK